MAKGSTLQLKLSGFEKLLEDIQAAGGNITGAAESAMKQSAHIMHTELKAQMRDAKFKTHTGFEPALINQMPPPTVEWKGNACIAHVGYKMGNYDPKNLSEGHKAVFLNYGTPRIAPTGFIKLAKKNAAPQIKKEQRKALQKILERTAKKNES